MKPMLKILRAAGIISVMLIIGLAVIGCGGGKGGNSPSGVAKQFYTAAEKGDVKAMTALMDPDSAQLIAAMAEKIEGTAENEGSIKKNVREKGGIIKAEEAIEDDTAKVTLTFKDGSTENLDLVKIDGKWKVTIKFK